MTRVKFVIFKGELLALFPDIKHSESLITCYAKIGQHSGASKDLMKLKYVKKDKYFLLLKELKNQGYKNLFVMNENKKGGEL